MDKSKVRRGEVFAINNKNIRGHRSLIINLDDFNIDTIVFTHSMKTRNIPNIKLQVNPDSKDIDEYGNIRDTFILKNIQKANIKDLGKYYQNFRVKNPVDKSVIRHISKKK